MRTPVWTRAVRMGLVKATYAYDNGGREASRSCGNEITTTRAYAADNRLTIINAQGVESLTYPDDANKKPTSETRSGVPSVFSWPPGAGAALDLETPAASTTKTASPTGLAPTCDAQSWQLSPMNDRQSFTNNSHTHSVARFHTHEFLTIAQPQAKRIRV